ncbi:MAG TPA: response regulator, partial [Bacteroidales bacterium]
MNVLIIEDERYAADKLKLLLQQIDPEISVINTLETVEGAVNWFRENASPDLILMDIQLSDGICFEIFEVIKINTPVIFITAYDEYAIRAFKVNSVDYLLKPVDQDALTGAIQKFKTLFPKKDADSNRIDRLVEALVKNYRTRFLVKVGLHYNSVLTNEIE